MPTFIALLRGINVGTAKRLPMAELRALLTELGYDGVTTLLNSGNAVFRAAQGTPQQHAAAISAAIAGQLGLQVPVIVKTAEELSAIVQGNPFDAATLDPSQLLVAFVQAPAALAGLNALSAQVVPPEQCQVGAHAAYLHCAHGILESQAAKALLGKSGKAGKSDAVTVTTRNWATVLKLQALAHASA